MDTSNLITKGYRTKSRLVNIQSNNKNEKIQTEATFYMPPEDIKRASLMSTIVLVILVTISMFIPITLILNFPILFVRFAYRQYSYNKAHKIILSFKCLNCGVDHYEQAYSGKLPIEILCSSCKKKSTVTDTQPEY